MQAGWPSISPEASLPPLPREVKLAKVTCIIVIGEHELLARRQLHCTLQCS